MEQITIQIRINELPFVKVWKRFEPDRAWKSSVLFVCFNITANSKGNSAFRQILQSPRTSAATGPPTAPLSARDAECPWAVLNWSIYQLQRGKRSSAAHCSPPTLSRFNDRGAAGGAHEKKTASADLAIKSWSWTNLGLEVSKHNFKIKWM